MKYILSYVYNRYKSFLNRILPIVFCLSKFTSFLYYTFFSHSFLREQQAVLCGKAKHLKEANKEKANYYLLIRNIHRIEKGLLMRPRKDIFAKKYLKETIDSFNGIYNQNKVGVNGQLKWFKDVLVEYFKVVGRDEEVDIQRVRFKKILNDTTSHKEKKIPYYRALEKRVISYEDFVFLSKRRRSVRWFQDKKVPRELIDKALVAALQAPSACNRQPFEFKIFDTPSLVEKIINIPMGTKGYAHNVPTVAVIIGNLDAYFDERDRHVIYIDSSLAAMSFMFALETLGLSSCPINWPDIEKKEKAMSKILQLERYQRPIMLVGIGYPDDNGKVACSEKRPLELIRKYY